jgi:hypothetical protein
MDTRAPLSTRQPHTLLAEITMQLVTDFTGHPGTVIKTTQFAAELTADEKSIIISHLNEAVDRYPDDASNGQ